MHIYTEEDIQYIKDNAAALSWKEIAEHLGINNLDSLKNKVSLLRKQGIDIPKHCKYPIGTIRKRTDRGYTVYFIKTANGWERTKVEKKEPQEKPIASVTVPRLIDKKVYKGSVKNKDNKVPLHIPELRMTVYVHPDANVMDVRKKYLNRNNNHLTSAM